MSGILNGHELQLLLSFPQLLWDMNCPQINPLLCKVMTNIICSSNAPDSTVTPSIPAFGWGSGGLWHHIWGWRPLFASPQLVQSCWWMEPAPGWLRVDHVGKVGSFPLSYLLCVPLAPCRPHNQLFALPPHCRGVRGGHRGGEALHFQLSSSSLMQGGGYESSISPALERGVMERKMGPTQMLKSQARMARHHDSI